MTTVPAARKKCIIARAKYIALGDWQNALVGIAARVAEQQCALFGMDDDEALIDLVAEAVCRDLMRNQGRVGVRLVSNARSAHLGLVRASERAAERGRPEADHYAMHFEMPVRDNWDEHAFFLPLKGGRPTPPRHRPLQPPARPGLPQPRVVDA